MRKCFVALCLCGVRVRPVTLAIEALVGHCSAKASSMLVPCPQLSQQCNTASSHLWTCTGTSSALVVCQETVWTFSKNFPKKTTMKWLVFYLDVEMTLFFQWTIVGFYTVCLKSWLLRSKFVSSTQLLEMREVTETHYQKNLVKEHCILSFSFARNTLE